MRLRASRAAASNHRVSVATMQVVPKGEISRRFLLSLTAALLAAPAPNPASAVGGTRGQLQIFDVAASELDRRSFRGLQLSNGLRVLLCSDPEANKAAASMNVAVGSMANPEEWPGLAHFCEHMLFLGTKRFPAEGEFERYISSNGGSNNAFTGAEDTNYYFDCGGDALPGALERFSGFFSEPLFTSSGTLREVQAIDSEHSKNLQSDFWRSDAVLRRRARPDHPYSRFFTGNKETLRGGDANARAALLAFWGQYYRAPQMALAVAGPQSLDTLQRLVLGSFSTLPTGPGGTYPPASLAYDNLPPPFDRAPLAPPQPPLATLLVPVREQRSVTLTWCLPVADVDAWLRAKPESTLVGLLSNRAEGSLAANLKARGLASSVDGSVDELTRTFAVLTCYISLTPQGLERWPEAVSAIFAYLELLREQGVPAHVFSEERRMRQLSFAYAEPASPQSFVQVTLTRSRSPTPTLTPTLTPTPTPTPTPVSFVQSASGGLNLLPPAEWLRGYNGVEDVSEQEELLKGVLAALTPQAALVKLTARELGPKATKLEPIYQARYGELPISQEVTAWSRPLRLAGLALPRPNRFIPTELGLKSKGGAPLLGHVKPSLLLNTNAARLHFLQDATFARPKAFAFVSLRTPQLYETPAVALQAESHQSLTLPLPLPLPSPLPLPQSLTLTRPSAISR